MADHDEQPLWLTLRGGALSGLVGWVVWAATLGLATGVLAVMLGPETTVVSTFLTGWLLARHFGVPTESLRRYHLDDDELTLLGPGRRVVRLPWSSVTTVTQTASHLILTTPGAACALPLARLYANASWFSVLRRVVPQVAAELWARLDDSVVELTPDPDPSTHALAWWVYGPLLIGCGPVLGAPALGLLGVLALLERAVVLLVVRRRMVTVHPAGLILGARRATDFVSWAHAEATPVVGGLRVAIAGRKTGVIPASTPNFWAAAAVIQLRTRLRDERPAAVYFRLRYANGGLAVVGEIEAP